MTISKVKAQTETENYQLNCLYGSEEVHPGLAEKI